MAIIVALPILARDFGTGAAEVTWIVAVSQLVTVSLLLVFSRSFTRGRRAWPSAVPARRG